jgi:hypothetical protein
MKVSLEVERLSLSLSLPGGAALLGEPGGRTLLLGTLKNV